MPSMRMAGCIPGTLVSPMRMDLSISKGRSKSMLLGSSGQNIYPEEIESKLINLPYISEAVVLMNKDHRLEALVLPGYGAGKGRWRGG